MRWHWVSSTFSVSLADEWAVFQPLTENNDTQVFNYSSSQVFNYLSSSSFYNNSINSSRRWGFTSWKKSIVNSKMCWLAVTLTAQASFRKRHFEMLSRKYIVRGKPCPPWSRQHCGVEERLCWCKFRPVVKRKLKVKKLQVNKTVQRMALINQLLLLVDRTAVVTVHPSVSRDSAKYFHYF